MNPKTPVQIVPKPESSQAELSGPEGPVTDGTALAHTPVFAHGAEFVIDAQTLHTMLGQENLLVVDVRTPAQCPDGHIPGAVRLDCGNLIRRVEPVEALLPDRETLSQVLSEIGIRPDHFVVAYDDDTGVDAARLLWILEVIGHRSYALLNGGFASWDDLEYEVADTPAQLMPSNFVINRIGPAVVDFDYVLAAINKDGVCIVDNRSDAEFKGEDIRAQRGGHIPGAVHYDWTSTIDLMSGGTLHDAQRLKTELHSLGITPDKEIILYCQSNRRSSHTFLILKWLGFENVKSYTGSWSEWGNRADAPIELS